MIVKQRKLLSILACTSLLTTIFSPFASLLSTPKQVFAQQTNFIQHSISNSAGDCKAVADIDLDGDIDVLLGGHSNAGEDLRWYSYPEIENTTSGYFIASPQDEFTTDCTTADVDGDGDLDVIAPDGPGSAFANILWFENPLAPSGNPTTDAWIKHTIGNSNNFAKDTHTADYDQDGNLDVAVRVDTQVQIFFQENNGAWTQEITSIGNGEGMGSGDVDQDGDIDLILQGEWWENTNARDISTWPQYTVGSGINQDFKAAVADINGDNVTDILYSSSENSADITWWSAPNGNVAANNWSSEVIQTNANRAHTLQTGDIDLDGDTDVIVGHMHTGSGNLYVYYNDDSTGTAWTQEQIGSGGIHNGRVADIDADGDLDIYGANWTGNNNHSWWENTLSKLDSWTYINIDDTRADQPFGMTFADLNNDGYEDVLTGREYYLNPGGNMSSGWVKNTVSESTDFKLALNVDDDAFVDVIATDTAPSNAIRWYEATASGQLEMRRVLLTIGPSQHTQGGQGYLVADIETGGKPEIVFNGESNPVTSDDAHTIFYLTIPADPENDAWTRNDVTLDATGDGFDIADVDGNGTLDIVSALGRTLDSNYPKGRAVAWWSNDGTPSNGLWDHNYVGTTNSQWADMTRARDFNNDGDIDIAFANENNTDSSIYLFTNNNTSWDKNIIFPSEVGENIATLDSADIDNDGDYDLVFGKHQGTSLDVIILENQDDGATWVEHNLGPAPAPYTGDHHVGTRLIDLDNDNDLDIVSHGFFDSEFVHLWRNDFIGGGGSTPTNQAPNVNAGVNQVVTLPTNTATLNGSVTDDGLPEGASVTTVWSQVSGPATATIANPNSLNTQVTLSSSGTYIFQLSADDTALQSSDTVSIILTAPSQAPAPLVALHFDEGNGTTATDSSGNGNNGIINNAGWITGKFGTGLNFAGINSNNNVNLGSLNLTGNQMTLAAWIKADTLPSENDSRIISKASNIYEQDHTWMLSTVSGTGLRLRLKTNGVTNTLVAPNANLPVGEWVHVAAIYDGTTAKLYKNGVEIASQTKSGTITTNSNTVLVGANPPTGYEVFDGVIDEVYIYQNALTETELAALINPIPNTPPIVNDLNATTNEDTDVTITLEGTDADENTLTYEIATQPANGSVLISGNIATYTPNANFNGSDSFTYIANDGTENSAPGTVNITVNSINDLPTAAITTNVTSGSQPLAVTFDAAQSSDVDGTITNYSWDFGNTNSATGAQVAHTYTNEGIFTAVLTVTDNSGGQDTENVEITVLSPNTAPIAQDIASTTNEDTALNITLQATDGDTDPLTYTLESQTANGQVSLQNNIVTYTPNANYNGSDTFTYSATDNIDTSNIATVTLTVNAINDSPTAAFITNLNEGLAPLAVFFDASSSSDVDGYTLTYTWDFGDGTASATGVTANHTYTEPGDYIATLTVTDPSGAEDNINMSITVLSPVANVVAAYSFDQSSGATLVDASGNGHTGNILGGATWATGYQNNSLAFDGNNDYVDIGNVSIPGDEMTIATWIYSNNFLDDDRIISKATGAQANQHYWMLSIANGNKLRFRLKTAESANTTTLIANSTSLPENQWVHVAATYDGSMMKLYINGVQQSQTATKSGNIADTTTPVYIGANPGAYAPWNGKIDELAIYDRALTTQEILDLVN